MLAVDLTKESSTLNSPGFHGNPCLSCGACCGVFRVSFYWREADEESGGPVPPGLTDHLAGFRLCMKGTNRSHPRCIALEGEIGCSVHCTIYDRRPTPCQNFGILFNNGTWNAGIEDLMRCNQARAAWGLMPLFTEPDDQRRHVSV
ncbi:MAG: YkgJ family cysteine cluster protein [Deltaproteobacteria bacterium]|nr:YkgJ family cysteine cluster protein [Deltaproteobacteria bacterium]